MKIVTINQLPETNSLDGKYGICSDSNGNVNKYNLDNINNISTLENTIKILNNTITDIEDELQAQYNYSPVEYVYVESLILRSDGIIKQSAATAYGVIYTPVSKGQTLHFYASEGKRFTTYANVMFTEEIPSVGVTGTVLSTPAEDGNAVIDEHHTAEKNGYMCFLVWNTTNYYIEDKISQVSELNTKVNILSKEIGIFNNALADMRKIESDYAVGMILEADGIIKQSDSTAYGVIYTPVSKGQKLHFYASEGKRFARYANVIFTEEIPSAGVTGTVLSTNETDGNAMVDFNYTAEKNGYVCFMVWAITNYYIETPSGLKDFVTSDEVENLIANIDCGGNIEEKSIPLDKIGWIRIGERVYEGSLGEEYRMSEYVDIRGWGGVKAVVGGNGSVENISFFDADKNFIPELSIKSNKFTEVRAYFNDTKYANVAYITLGSKTSDYTNLINAYLIPISYIKNEQSISRYRKLMVIGDSLTNSTPQGLEEGEYPHKWGEVVCSKLNIPSIDFAGGAGANVANVGDNTIYSHVMDLTLDEDIDIITFWGGTNDYGNEVEIGDFTTEVNIDTRDNTTFIGGLCDCVEKLLTLYPTKKIILIGTTPRTFTETTNYHNKPNDINKYLYEYVDAVKKVAEWYGLPFLDLLRTSGFNLFNMEYFFYPQYNNMNQVRYLHFNQKGENHIGEKIAAFIRTI